MNVPQCICRHIHAAIVGIVFEAGTTFLSTVRAIICLVNIDQFSKKKQKKTNKQNLLFLNVIDFLA